MVNWVDIIIIALLIYEIYDGWKRGFAVLLANLFSFLASLWLSVRYHGLVGSFVTEKFGVSSSWGDVIGYMVIALGSQVLIESVLMLGVNKLPQKFQTSRVNRWLGGLVSAGSALLIAAFFLLLALQLPLRGSIKQDIKNSMIGSRLVILSERYGGAVQSSLDEISRGAIRFVTVAPDSGERIPLDLPQKTISLAPDAAVETRMVALVNKERSSRGIPEFRVDADMVAVAREKSRDMFDRRYFSHYDPEGKNAADRMNAAGVAYTFVGENLAYAPDLASAHEGLMNSEGHRVNMLETRFHRIGIGVIDSGNYGLMFTQLFAD